MKKYTVSVTERVNLGSYEFMEVSASIEFTEDDADGDPAKFGASQLDNLLRSHRQRALQLVPEDSASFMLDHPAMEN